MHTGLRTTIIPAILIATVLLACGATGGGQAGAAEAAPSPKPPDAKGDVKTDSKSGGKAASKGDAKSDAKSDAQPACMHCGGHCCLTPICVCEPGTKKRPRTEYEVTCEPICVPGCGSKPWPFGRHHPQAGCTASCVGPCRCPGWVRDRQKVKKETVEEDVPTIKRKVAYVCATCAACRGGRVDKTSWWWSCLPWLAAKSPAL